MKLLAFAAALAALAPGCVGGGDDPAPPPSASAADLGVRPTFAKVSLATPAGAAATAPIDDLLGNPPQATRPLDVPDGTAAMRLAIDVAPDGEPPAEGPYDVTVRVLDAAGAVVYESPKLAQAGKLVADVARAAGGRHTVVAEHHGAWAVGLVAVFLPAGHDPGLVVSVAFPEQTEVDHSFQPARIEAPASKPLRITLYDYDPHAGIENLQHNLFFPTLGIRTEGKTTWGEVRTLDLVAPAQPGTYGFECEFHRFQGALVVA